MNAASVSPSATTDAELSLRAPEFVWNSPAPTPAHDYLFPTIRAWLKKAGARDVLDLGCGNGALTSALAGAGFSMTGVDVSDSGLAIAARSFPQIQFHRSGMSEALGQPLRRRFDAVIAVEVIEHLLLPRELIDRAREALRPGGILIVTTPFHGYWKNLALALTNKFDQHWHPLRDYGHVKFFSRETLTGLFAERGVRVDRFARVGRIPAFAKSMILQGSFPQSDLRP
jgi:2-polyprenyl-3-methyl-5-hydroxy-6-metoxy-1,4-benzoquinol methylase